MEAARRQQQREEEALRRQAERKAAQAQAPAARPTSRVQESDAWRRSGPPSSPRPGVATPPRSESPAPAAGKYRPGALGGAGGGWRAREAAKQQATASGDATPARPASPAVQPPAREEPAKDTDGFQTVEKKNVWRPSRLRGRDGA